MCIILDNAYNSDPRVREFKAEEQRQKEKKKKDKQEAARAKQEEGVRKREEEAREIQRQKEETERIAKEKVCIAATLSQAIFVGDTGCFLQIMFWSHKHVRNELPNLLYLCQPAVGRRLI